MKTKSVLAVLLLCLACVPQDPGDRSEGDDAKTAALPEWFRNGKFGLFIHWGPYSVLGGEWKGKRIEQGDIAEWIMERFHIPVEEYREVAAAFNPVRFNAREWVALLHQRDNFRIGQRENFRFFRLRYGLLMKEAGLDAKGTYHVEPRRA